MLHLTYFIHANLQYAEFPESAVPAIVERSYLPTLEYFAANPALRAAFEYSGVTLERLARDWPRAVDLLRLMAARGQIELVGSSFANPIMPLLPTDHARRQLAAFRVIFDELFGDLAAPHGVYLQEFAYDPALAPLLREAGYDYTILTPELLRTGLRRALNSAHRVPRPHLPDLQESVRLELLHPLRMLGARDACLNAVPLHRDLIDLLFGYSNGERSLDEILALLAALNHGYGDQTPALLVFGPSDAEFIGFYDYLGRRPLAVEALGTVMAAASQLPFVHVGLPGEYLRAFPPVREVYVPAGTSEPTFDLWVKDPDNVRLNALCAEAAGKLQLAEALANRAAPGVAPALEEAWRAMLLAENSDGRGWLPCPERRLFCYSQALRAVELAESLLAGRLLPAGVFSASGITLSTPDTAA